MPTFSPGMTDELDAELRDAAATCRGLMDAYLTFGHEYQHGEVIQQLYSDLLEFVNFRMETADSCLLLVEHQRVADALGLCRSLLENYLLLKLMCRGTKYFQLQNFDKLTEGQFKTKIKELQEELAAKRAEGTTHWLEVRGYPRPPRRHAMYVAEGLKDDNEEGFTVPLHYFQFREFHPETMRLKDENYFVYYEPPEDLKQKRKDFVQQETFRYKHYLSYDALLVSLELNGLADDATQARIEAHYTFLGRFLHPTHEAARDLHELANVHYGQPEIGMSGRYTRTAMLLALVYVCHILADILDEVAGLFEGAPKKYITNPGTQTIRRVASEARERFDYFWFIYNDPTKYDKYIYAIHHVSNDDLQSYGGYEGVPNNLVAFNQHIYGQFQAALGSWSNQKCGVYESPLRRQLRP